MLTYEGLGIADYSGHIRGVTVLCGQHSHITKAHAIIAITCPSADVRVYPERCLHPSEQLSVACELVGDATESPVVVLTASPYILQMLITEAISKGIKLDVGDVTTGGVGWTQDANCKNSPACARMTEPMRRIQLYRDWDVPMEEKA